MFYHVAFVMDVKGSCTYVDGVQTTKHPHQDCSVIVRPTSEFCIGAGTSPECCFSGTIADFKIFYGALS